jgi:hypothetical protein
MRGHIWIGLGLCSAIACSEYKLGGAGDAAGTDSGGARDAYGDPGDSDDPGGDGETASVSGRVCDPSGGDWVVGAYAWVEVDDDGDGTEDWRAEDTTDEDGRFSLEGLPVGEQVVHVEKGSFAATFDVTLDYGNYEIPEDECALDPPTIAVISGDYDHIEDILEDLSLEYTTFSGTTSEYIGFLRDPSRMAEFDIIFFNCGIADTWFAHEAQIAANVAGFVNDGGSVYASDWAHYFVEAAFPGKIDFYGEDALYSAPRVGMEGSVTAQVIDPTMQAIIGGSSASINYDLSMWVVPQAVSSDVEILLQARATVLDFWTGSTTTIPNAPIAARFDVSGGRVIYTSFHNEHQATTVHMRDILEEIILSL